MIKQTTEESPETAECPACADTFLAGTANEDGWCEECDSERHHRALPAKVAAFSEASAPALSRAAVFVTTTSGQKTPKQHTPTRRAIRAGGLRT